MCHYRHRAHSDALFWPGIQDITAWVDFTRVAEAAHEAGLEVCGYATQSGFLLESGFTDFAGLEAHGLSAGHAKRLVLPGDMGERFRVMGLSRGGIDKPPGFSARDLRYSL